MRRLLFAPLAGALLLSSCEHAPDLSFLDQVQQAVIQKCSYVPTIRALLALLNVHPNWTNAADIADRICAIVPHPRGPRTFPQQVQPTPVLDNVPLPGWFVGPSP